jgi:hypothetical protein
MDWYGDNNREAVLTRVGVRIMTGGPQIVGTTVTNRVTGRRHNQATAEQHHGAGVEVFIGLNPVVELAGRPAVSLESYLQRNALDPKDFPGRNLELVASETVGLLNTYYNDRANPSKETSESPATHSFVLIAKTAK